MLGFSQILPYAIALAIAAAIPGPGMTALIARSISFGATSGFVMLAGLIIGDLFYLSFAVFGLAVITTNFNEVFFIVKYGAAIYLCYLAWIFWNTKHQSLNITQVNSSKDLFAAGLSGFTITIGNPKTIGFYLALLPIIIELDQITIQQWALSLVPLTILVLLSVGALFILGALAVRQALSGIRAQKLLYRGAASAMLFAASMMIAK